MIEYYTLTALYTACFIYESYVTGLMIKNRSVITLPRAQYLHGITGLSLVSVSNLLAFLRLHHNYTTTGIDPGNYVQAIQAFSFFVAVTFVARHLRHKWGSDG